MAQAFSQKSPALNTSGSPQAKKPAGTKKPSHEQLGEKDLDKALEDTFPASDPPSH